MVDRDLVEAFNDCIDRLANGSSLQECLRAYPQFAEQLRPMLIAGRLVRRAQLTSQEVQSAQDRVRFRFEQALTKTPAPVMRSVYPRLLAFVASVVLIFGVLLGGASVIAQDSLPGDALYSLKRLTEDVRLLFSPNRDSLEMTFADRRLQETRDLLTTGRNAEVTFSGNVESVEGRILLVEGLRIDLQNTNVDLSPLRTGVRVEIEATTSNGVLIIRDIRLIDMNNNVIPIPVPSATTIITPTLTETPQITPSATLTPTPLPTVTATPTATLTPSQTPTILPTRLPQATNTERPCVVAPPPNWETYRIQSGDTLFELALARNVTVEQVRRANCLTETSVIRPGQIIYLPTQTTPDANTGISREQAQTIAVSRYPGASVTGINLIVRNGQQVWVVGLSNGVIVYVNATNGEVIAVEDNNTGGSNNPPPMPTPTSERGNNEGGGRNGD